MIFICFLSLYMFCHDCPFSLVAIYLIIFTSFLRAEKSMEAKATIRITYWPTKCCIFLLIVVPTTNLYSKSLFTMNPLKISNVRIEIPHLMILMVSMIMDLLQDLSLKNNFLSNVYNVYSFCFFSMNCWTVIVVWISIE